MTALRQYSSFWPVIGWNFERSPFGMKPPGSSNFVLLLVEREIGNGEVVRHAGAVAEPVGIEAGHGADVGDVDVLHERDDLVEQRFHLVQPVDVERRLAVDVDGVLHAADGDVLDVRRLAAEHATTWFA